MKPEHYNSKAREAFAKSLIDTGVAIFKGVLLLIILLPISYIVKAGLDGRNASVDEVLSSISSGTFLIVLVLLIIGVVLGVWFRNEGVRHLHEMENEQENLTNS